MSDDIVPPGGASGNDAGMPAISLSELLGRLKDIGGPRPGGWYEAACPAHPDSKRSLIIKELPSGDLLIKCRAGCERDAILAALGFGSPPTPAGDSDEHTQPPVTSNFLPRNPDGSLARLYPRPLFGGDSLEVHVAAGDGQERASAKRHQHDVAVSVTLNAVPHSVYFTLLHVQRQAQLESLATTTRYVARAGAQVLARIAAIPQLDQEWHERYLAGREESLKGFTGRTWPGFRALSAQAHYLKASVFYGVNGLLSNLAHAAGLSSSAFVQAALVARLAQSEAWVPDEYLARFGRAILEFCEYLEGRAARS